MKNIKYIIIILLTILLLDNRVSAYKEYNIGDEVSYNRMQFYVIKNSGTNEEYVTLLKKKPFTVEEINLYGGVGTDNNYVNKYTKSSVGAANNSDGYGGAVYYTSEECGYVNDRWNTNDCKLDYNSSDVKHIVDNWGSKKFDTNDLATDSTGYTVRLLTFDELKNDLGYGEDNRPTTNTPNWIYNFQIYNYYWITGNGANAIFAYGGYLETRTVYGYSFATGGRSSFGMVRPVVTINKSAINKVIDDEEDEYADKDYNSHAQETYEIGDELVYKGEKYHAIKNSSEKDDSVIILKDTPLTVEEVNLYGGVGTENNRVNMYVTSNEFAQYYQEAYDNDGYGGMAYLSRNNCEQVRCTNDYDESDVKYVVDAWANDKLGADNYGSVRLMKEDEYINLCDTETHLTPSGSYNTYTPQYDFLYNENYTYLLMDSEKIVGRNGDFNHDANNSISKYYNVVRPVVELKKCAMDKSCEKSDEESRNDKENSRITDDEITTINVPDTLKKVSVIFIMIGIIATSISLVVLVKNKDKIKKEK